MTYLDKTYCASPNCTNKCGRKMSEQEKIYLGQLTPLGGQFNPVSVAYFCGEPEEIAITDDYALEREKLANLENEGVQ